MRKPLLTSASLTIFLLISVFNTGCFKDKVRYTYQISTPVFETLTAVRASYKAIDPQPLQAPAKIYIKGNYIFVNEPDKGIHIIDDSDPSHPANIAFINLPGNQDIAVKDQTLYGDAYGDLVAFNISDPKHVVLQKAITNVFTDRAMYYNAYATNNPDSMMVIVSWKTKDTTVDYKDGLNPVMYYNNCANCAIAFSNLVTAPAASGKTPVTGTGGSMARFAIIRDYLYTVGFSTLESFDITNTADPQFSSTLSVDTHIETLYPFEDKLFIGSNIGMYMYDVSSSPGNPSKIGQFTHARACDPVITDGKYAYVTLSDGTSCLGIEDQMDVVDITDINNPSLVKTYLMTHPKGLAKDGDLLFVCDDKDGLMLYDAKDPDHIRLTQQIKNGSPNDIIAYGGLAIVMATEGIFQYDYSDPANIHLLSKIPISK